MKILVIALSGIGDALMFTPALKVLKKEIKGASIDLLVMYSGVKDIYTDNPDVNEIIHFDFLNSPKIESLKFVCGLRGKYDASINVYPSNRIEYNLINFIIGAPKRAGVKYLRSDFRELGFLNNQRIEEDDRLHNVMENVRLVEMLTGKKTVEVPDLRFNLSGSDLGFADEFIKANRIKFESPVIGFHPGCSTLKNHERRRWDPQKFGMLAKMLINKYDATVLIFGGPDEKELKAEVMRWGGSSKIFSVEAKSLANSAALIKKCGLFITNDSSLMHVAAAMKRKTIAIIGPTNSNYIHPWGTDYKIVSLNLDCSPCFRYSPKPLSCSREDVKFKCVQELGVDIVFDSACGEIDSVKS